MWSSLPQHTQAAVPAGGQSDSLRERLAALKHWRLAQLLDREPFYVSVVGHTSSFPSLDSPEEPPILQRIQDRFGGLQNHDVCSVLILGPSGVGKSTVLRQLERCYWETFDESAIGEKPQVIPIYLALRECGLPQHRELTPRQVALQSQERFLKEEDFKELDQVQVECLWMFDGYDEMGGSPQPICRVLEDCRLSIVTCDQDFVDVTLQGRVWTYLRPSGNPRFLVHDILYLRNFERPRILEYFQQTVGEDLKTVLQPRLKGFAKMIDSVPAIRELVSNPLMLSLFVRQVPTWTKKFPQLKSLPEDEETRIVLTSTEILESFVMDYYSTSRDLLMQESGWPSGFEVKFSHQCESFCKRLALLMLQEGTIVADPAREPFRKLFPSESDSLEARMASYLLRAIPLERRLDDKLTFLHKAVWEYYVALSNTTIVEPSSEESLAAPEPDTVNEKERLSRLVQTLGTRSWTQYRALLHKHAELIATQPDAMRAYVDIIFYSRDRRADASEDNKLITAASNAVSVLNYGALSNLFAFRFDEVRDWSRIRIPYANLNQARLLNCDFSCSMLSHCTFLGAILDGSHFDGADLTEGRADDNPVVIETSEIGHGPFLSPDGLLLAVSLKLHHPSLECKDRRVRCYHGG